MLDIECERKKAVKKDTKDFGLRNWHKGAANHLDKLDSWKSSLNEENLIKYGIEHLNFRCLLDI